MPFGLGSGSFAVAVVLDSLFASVVRGVWTPGRRPWTVGIIRLAGVPMVLVLVGDLGRVGGGVIDKRHLVAVVRLSLRRHSKPCVGWLRVLAEGKLLSGVFLDRGGDVLGRRTLLEGVVAALSAPFVLLVKT